MLTVIVFLLIAILFLLMELVILTAKGQERRERIPLREQAEDKRLRKERREAEREQSREATRRMELMRKVEEYDGTVR